MKKLYRSGDNKLVGGVCGGIGEYFEIDPTLVRLLLILVALITLINSLMSSVFALAAVYVMAWLIIPERPETKEKQEAAKKPEAQKQKKKK